VITHTLTCYANAIRRAKLHLHTKLAPAPSVVQLETILAENRRVEDRLDGVLMAIESVLPLYAARESSPDNAPPAPGPQAESDQGCVTGGPMPEYLRNKRVVLHDRYPAPGPQAPPAVAEAAVGGDDEGGEDGEPWPPVAGQRVEAKSYIGHDDGVCARPAVIPQYLPARIVEVCETEPNYFWLVFDHNQRRVGRAIGELRSFRPSDSDSAATAFLGEQADPAHERAMAGEGVERG
jgi:hypothetical protein